MKILLAALLAATANVAGAVTYDPLLDYSTASNPNGVYSYGYENTLGGALTLFSNGGAANGITTAWTSPAVDQYLGVYDVGTAILQHPGLGSLYSILRITVATASTYTISGDFANGDHATTDVHILINGTSAFDNTINGPGSQDKFGFTEILAAGSTIDFAVGNGGNGYNNDSTLLNASVSAVPEPAMWSLLIAGFAMTGFAARRRSAALAA